MLLIRFWFIHKSSLPTKNTLSGTNVMKSDTNYGKKTILRKPSEKEERRRREGEGKEESVHTYQFH
jgi:hypothetical protein